MGGGEYVTSARLRELRSANLADIRRGNATVWQGGGGAQVLTDLSYEVGVTNAAKRENKFKFKFRELLKAPGWFDGESFIRRPC